MIISLGLSGHLLDCHVEVGCDHSGEVGGTVAHVQRRGPGKARRQLAQARLLPPRQRPHQHLRGDSREHLHFFPTQGLGIEKEQTLRIDI